MNSPTITEQVLGLPLLERVKVAEAVWASIDGEFSDTTPADAILVARERDSDFDSGRVAGKSHEDVMADVRRRLG